MDNIIELLRLNPDDFKVVCDYLTLCGRYGITPDKSICSQKNINLFYLKEYEHIKIDSKNHLFSGTSDILHIRRNIDSIEIENEIIEEDFSTVLILEDRSISHLDFLKNRICNALEGLYLGNNGLSDLEGLEKFQANNLKTLDLKRNHIEIIGKLNFPKLKFLDLDYNNLEDLDSLENLCLPNLTHMRVFKNKLKNIDGLFYLNAPKLKQFYCSTVSKNISKSSRDRIRSKFPNTQFWF